MFIKFSFPRLLISSLTIVSKRFFSNAYTSDVIVLLVTQRVSEVHYAFAECWEYMEGSIECCGDATTSHVTLGGSIGWQGTVSVFYRGSVSTTVQVTLQSLWVYREIIVEMKRGDAIGPGVAFRGAMGSRSPGRGARLPDNIIHAIHNLDNMKANWLLPAGLSPPLRVPILNPRTFNNW